MALAAIVSACSVGGVNGVLFSFIFYIVPFLVCLIVICVSQGLPVVQLCEVLCFRGLGVGGAALVVRGDVTCLISVCLCCSVCEV